MLSAWIKKLVLAAAISIMPVQGIAGALALLCHGKVQAHASQVVDTQDHGEHAAPHAHEAVDTSEKGSDGAVNNFHPCCNLGVPPSITVNTELPKFHPQVFVPVALHDHFVPDQPQRPPLA